MRHRNSTRHRRRGNIMVMTAFVLTSLGAMIAFAVDLGYLENARCELQRSADAAAIAGAMELTDNSIGPIDLTNNIALAKSSAVTYAASNKVCTTAPTLNIGATDSDVVVGYLSDPSDQSATLNASPALTNSYNSVQVRVRRTSSQNGNVPFFFGHLLGLSGIGTQSQATAAMLRNMKGFKTPSSGENLGILPFALDKQTWDAMLAGGGTDNYSWNPNSKTIGNGPDGVREVNLYPQGTGSPGNRGTVDIGSPNNSTADIARQIVYGLSPADLAYMGGKIQLNDSGQLFLNGDTGISAGIKDELASIAGQPRIIPIFDQVTGPGNNATYRIVEFVGVRILSVKLTGSMSSKQVMIQPAKMITTGGIPGGTAQTSYYIYSPAWLVR